jgi:hypothetical protein
MKKEILIVCCSFFLFACQKGKNDSPVLIDERKDISTENPQLRPLDGCTNFTALGNNGDGTYTASYGPGLITLSTPYYQAICDDGSTVVLRNGLPAWTSSFTVTGNSSVLLSPNDPTNTSNQFVIVSGTALTNWSAYSQAVSNFLSAWSSYIGGGGGTIPYVTDFLPAPNGDGTIVSTGKLIRVTTGSNFALAPLCHPEPPACMFVVE